MTAGRQDATAYVPMTYKEGILSLRLSGAQKEAIALTTIHGVLRGTPDIGMTAGCSEFRNISVH